MADKIETDGTVSPPSLLSDEQIKKYKKYS